MPGGHAVWSPIEAAATIDRLLAEPAAWQALSDEGRAAAIDTYALDRNIDRLVDVIEGKTRAGG
jgi:hypothetical protein